MLLASANLPELRRNFWGLFNLSFGFFGIQVGFALQGANVSRIFQTLGASVEALPILWVAAPLTGLLVQPLVGHFSDRTRLRFGRRRPYFLLGAMLSCLALAAMPDAKVLWAAALLLWLLDASINVSMEPFRAFVGDLVASSQRTAAYAFQTVFIGCGAVAASLAPVLLSDSLGIANTAPVGVVPPSVRYAFYLGAVVLLVAVLWTVVTTREVPISPEEDSRSHRAALAAKHLPRRGILWAVGGLLLAIVIAVLDLGAPLYVLAACLIGFGVARIWTAARCRRGARANAAAHILADLDSMPSTMRRLAIVQFCSWIALFVLWIYATPTVTARAFGAAHAGLPGYADGADWVGVMFATYNGIAAIAALVLPRLVRQIGAVRVHQVALLIGAAAFAALFLLHDAHSLLVAMIGVGILWAAVLTLPYTILCDVVPRDRLGSYMGLFNIFIVLPQLVVSSVMGTVVAVLFAGQTEGAMLVGAVALLVACMVAGGLRGPEPVVTRDPVAG